MRRRNLLAVALADCTILALYGVVAWAVWQITNPRVSALLSWASTGVVLALGVGTYLHHSLPWWRKALVR